MHHSQTFKLSTLQEQLQLKTSDVEAITHEKEDVERKLLRGLQVFS